jgi:hypothetical protein
MESITISQIVESRFKNDSLTNQKRWREVTTRLRIRATNLTKNTFHNHTIKKFDNEKIIRCGNGFTEFADLIIGIKGSNISESSAHAIAFKVVILFQIYSPERQKSPIANQKQSVGRKVAETKIETI